MTDLIVWIPKEQRKYTCICPIHSHGCDYRGKTNQTYIEQTGVCKPCYQMLITAAFHNGCEEDADSLRSPTSLGLWR